MFSIKDKNQSSSKARKSDITVLLYEDLQLPKCFEIRRNSLKLAIFGLPMLIFLLTGIILFLGFSIWRLQDHITFLRPEIEKRFIEEKAQLQNKFAVIKNENNSLLEKLKAPPLEKEASLLPGLFQKVIGQKDLSNKSLILIQSLKAEIKDKKLQISFDLLNPSPESTTLRGHIFLLIQDKTGLYFYPRPRTKDMGEEILRFDDGESFTISRFRPFEAFIDLPPRSSIEKGDLTISIFIFSRLGDLLYKKMLAAS